jgi:hypothetical protein
MTGVEADEQELTDYPPIPIMPDRSTGITDLTHITMGTGTIATISTGGDGTLGGRVEEGRR